MLFEEWRKHADATISKHLLFQNMTYLKQKKFMRSTYQLTANARVKLLPNLKIENKIKLLKYAGTTKYRIQVLLA